MSPLENCSSPSTSSLHSVAVGTEDELPSVGLGLWKIAPQDCAAMVRSAIEFGYRHLDSACDYGNETQVGAGIQQALSDRLCRREDLWITSKLWNTYHRPEHVRPALERSLRDLQVDYLDLYLIHFPISLKFVPMDQSYPPGWLHNPQSPSPKMLPDSVPLADTWGALEQLQQAGLIKHLGVSNFGTSLLRDLLAYASVPPRVLQVESHPYLVQAKLLRFCQQHQMAVTAFSPLGAGSYIELGMATSADSVLQDPVVKRIADQHGRSPAQIVLRWAVQRGTAAIPKTSQVARLKENLSIYDFQLSSDEMQCISGLDRNRRYNDPGVFCELAFGCFYPIYE